METTNATIDEIKNKYQYKVDPSNFAHSCSVEFGHLNARFLIFLEKSKFYERIKEIQKILDKKGDTIDRNKLESYKKTIIEIFDGVEEMKKKAEFDYDKNIPILGGLSYSYECNMNKPGAKEMYLKISKSIIDEEVKILVNNHKKLILYNDELICVKKNLTK